MDTPLLHSEFEPRSELVTQVTEALRPRFPVIDAHNHLPVDDWGVDPDRLAALTEALDQVDVRAVVNLSGGFGDRLRRTLDALDRAHEGRIVTFCNVDWEGVGEPGWAERATSQLRDDVAAGAKGLKVFKELGLRYRDTDGRLVSPDDPRIADVWAQAGELGVPVLIHSADPVAFFRPLDRNNERWDELQRRPNWHFYGEDFPAFEELIEALYRTIEAHPNTKFITAHVGCYPENLGFVSQMLDRYPNMYTDISARIAELGRAPYSARKWFLRYADRILYGTDVTPTVAMYRNSYRFLETDDEYFDYAVGARIPPQGRWKIYGLFLPDEVLRKVYYDNAASLLGPD
jgi:predicted TIM-barrel fold metal-dependent hydrolase